MTEVFYQRGPGTCRPWTPGEIKFLRENYALLGGPACAKIVGRSVFATATKASCLGITRGQVHRANQVPVEPPRPRIAVPPNPAVRESSFIKPIPRERLMAGR